MAQNAFGLGLAKDQVVPLNIGGKSARLEALLGNKVPAAILDPPYTTMAAEEGYKLLVDLAPMDVPYLRNIVAVSEKSLREDSRTVSRFVVALLKGCSLIATSRRSWPSTCAYHWRKTAR
jgi:ABC-type nitrate/sulfonate/bicarbonate transport system substrate-binding protein